MGALRGRRPGSRRFSSCGQSRDGQTIGSQPMNTPSPPDASAPKNGRLNQLLAEYGPLALMVYMSIFVVVLVSFAWAIEWGFKETVDRWARDIGSWLPWLADDAEATGSVGTWAAAYVAAKLTQPLRIPLTVALTALIHRFRVRSAEDGGASASRSDD